MVEGSDDTRYCPACEMETEIGITRGNNGRIEYCSRCSFDYEFWEDNDG